MAAEYDVDKVLTLLETGHDRPVYWLPGNHDPLSTYEQKKKFGKRSINLHGVSRFEIKTGLFVCGFGGAVPGYQNGYNVWAHFPFNEHQYGTRLSEVWETAESSEKEQFILLTHCGPSEVSTTTALHELSRGAIESGSSNLRRLIESSAVQKTVLFNLHGHTHMSSGLVRVGHVAVVNPGALVENRYGVIELTKKEGNWELEGVSFKRL
jgi:Icc-related predicted phosphoesterase